MAVPRRLSILVVGALLVVLAAVGLAAVSWAYLNGRLPGPQPSPVERAAVRAWWHLKRHATVHFPLEEPAGMPLPTLLRVYSLLLVCPTGERLTTYRQGSVLTWLPFSEATLLSPRRALPHVSCPQRPPQLQSSDAKFVLSLLTGTARVFGVPVTLETSQSAVHLEARSRYLVLSTVCGDGILLLPYARRSIIAVQSDGRFVPPSDLPPDSEHIRTLLALRNLAELSRYLERLPAQ